MIKLLSLLRKFSLSIVLLIALNGCDGKDTWCFTTAIDAYSSPDNIKNTNNTVVQVNSSGIDPNNAGSGLNQWVSSGVNVTQGDEISLAATGTIILSTPYGLSSSVASGDSVATNAGNPQDQAAMQAYNDMITGQDYSSYYANNGLGMLYNIQANATGTTPITVDGTFDGDFFPFTLNQVITVSTADCATGTTNKWTWNNGWIYTVVRCDYEGHNRNFTASDDPSDVQCKAIHRCDNNTIIINDQYKGWLCHLNAKVNSNYTSVPTSDSCSSSAGGYNCEYNDDYPNTCASWPTAQEAGQDWYRDDGGDFCNGSHKDGNNITVSDQYPGCSWNNSTANITSPILNPCGTTDTCWNTNGYRLYAIQGSAVGSCPATLNSNCVHLNQSAASQGGKSFPAAGGQVNLQIIDPNAAPLVPTSTVTDDQNQINANNTAITNLTNTNSTLNSTLITNLGSSNNFTGLDCSQISYLQTTASTYASIIPSSAMNTTGTASVDSILNNISNALITLNGNCNSFTSYVAPSYVPNPSTSTPWLTTLSTINASLPNILSLASSLGNPALPDSSPVTSTNLASYQATLVSVITYLQTYSTTNSFNGTLPALRLSVPTTTNLSSSDQDTLTSIINSMKSIQTTMNNGDTNLANYSNDCFNKQISLGYIEQNPDATDVNGNPLPPSWMNSLTSGSNNINGKINSLQNLVNNLSNSSSISSYKASLNTMISNLTNAISSATTTYNSIYTNTYSAVSGGGSCSTSPASITSLNNCNIYLQNEILTAQNNSGSTAIGGYQVYVKSEPVMGYDGTDLKAVISQCNPNVDPCSYDNDLGPVTATITTSTMPSSGTIWLKINDPDGNYNNNMGSYDVSVGQTSITTSFGGLFADVVNLIKNGVYKMTRTIFENITCSNSSGVNLSATACYDYLTSVKIILNLYIVIFGMMFLFGLIQVDYVDFLIRVIKIALVIILIGPNSFNFFNQYFFSGVLNFSSFLFTAATGAPLDNPFTFLNQSIAMLMFDPVTYIKLIALTFQGMIGIVVFVVLICGTIDFLKAVYKAFEVYIMCFIGLALCFAVAPIFIIFLLFKTTQSLFSNWFSAIVRFTLEPVILFVGLIILNGMMMSLLQQLLNFSACYKCTFAFGFSIPGLFSLGNDSLFCIPFFSPWGVDNVGSGMSFNLFMSIPLVISFAIVTKVMEIYSKKMSKEMTAALLGEGLLFGGHKTKPGEKEPNMGINPFSGSTNKINKLTGNTKQDKARRQQMKNDSMAEHKADQVPNAAAASGNNAPTTVPTSSTQTAAAAQGGNNTAARPSGKQYTPEQQEARRIANQTRKANSKAKLVTKEKKKGLMSEIKGLSADGGDIQSRLKPTGLKSRDGIDAGREASIDRAAQSKAATLSKLADAKKGLKKTETRGGQALTQANMMTELKGKIQGGVTSGLTKTETKGGQSLKQANMITELKGKTKEKSAKIDMMTELKGKISDGSLSSGLKKTDVEIQTSQNKASMMSELKDKTKDVTGLNKTGIDGRQESKVTAKKSTLEGLKEQKMEMKTGAHGFVNMQNRSTAHSMVMSDIKTNTDSMKKVKTDGRQESINKSKDSISLETTQINKSLAQSKSIVSPNQTGGHNPMAGMSIKAKPAPAPAPAPAQKTPEVKRDPSNG